MAEGTTSDTISAITDKSLGRILHSAGISALFQEKYPYVRDLMNYNFERATNLLCLRGSFQLYNFDQSMRYAHTWTTNTKTWLDYLAGIVEYLKSLNDDCRLETARQKLAEHIHTVHYDKFPFWPSVNDLQSSEVVLDVCGSHRYGQFMVGWSCHGRIVVKEMRPTSDIYYTDFQGRPEFKVLNRNHKNLDDFEELATRDMAQMKAMVDEYKKPLSWDALATMLTN